MPFLINDKTNYYLYYKKCKTIQPKLKSNLIIWMIESHQLKERNTLR